MKFSSTHQLNPLISYILYPLISFYFTAMITLYHLDGKSALQFFESHSDVLHTDLDYW